VTLALGCDGGNVDVAYLWVLRYQGGYFNREVDYPYTAKAGKCSFNSTLKLTVLSDYGSIAKSETALVNALYELGPITAAIDASHSSFTLYTNGIYNETACSTTNLNHQFLLVGWGVGYFLAKNSFGTSWGEKGYIRMTRNGSNQCGIASETVLPFIE
jgi:cathepsin L